jgi:hypothetical protein
MSSRRGAAGIAWAPGAAAYAGAGPLRSEAALQQPAAAVRRSSFGWRSDGAVAPTPRRTRAPLPVARRERKGMGTPEQTPVFPQP